VLNKARKWAALTGRECKCLRRGFSQFLKANRLMAIDMIKNSLFLGISLYIKVSGKFKGKAKVVSPFLKAFNSPFIYWP
jgi:hypothetical protein